MGKWTAEYYDNVLSAKMRSLVSGAIKRARLEKAEPSITYETFVEDLDRGDSFTTSLIEVLVKEVAERRYRHHAADRGLIGDRTARSLRKLSSHTSIYRERIPGRGLGGRRGMDLAEYLSQPPDELEVDEDDDELGPYGTFVMEGSRFNTEIYDAYRSQHSWSNSSTPYFLNVPHTSPPMSSAPPPDAASDRILPPLVDASPPQPPRQSWPVSSSSGFMHSTLSRQPSILRLGRNRVSDFSEFTAARRNSTRQLTQDEDHTARSELPAPHNPELPPSSSLGPRSSSAQARRFFPFGRTRRFEIIPTPRPATSMSDDWYFPPHSAWSTNPSERLGGRDEPGVERSQAPRLRRGGLRAPESMLSRHTSTSPPIGVPTIAFPTPEELQRVTAAAAANGAPISTSAMPENTSDVNLEGEGLRPVEERV
ncbi:hypothetical protein JVU11DRAFT_2035 [Chiua virens]|nr:hypothetical protein JVU11DRAFT_2035 [Chiua virens]